MNDPKTKVLAQILVRNQVAPRKKRPPPPAEPEKKAAEAPAGDIPTLDAIVLDEPRHHVQLTTLELRALRHARKVRSAGLNVALSLQEKEQIMAYCKRQGFPSASSWLRNLAFKAMGKPIPTRSPKSKNRG